MTPRKGDWMTTFTGRKFWPLDPRPEEVDIKDIAHALSMSCRFGGHCRSFYSVAEHSVRCWTILPSLACLLHDATEAYASDIIRPVKQYLPDYFRIEAAIAHAIESCFGLEWGATSSPEIKRIDSLLLSTEHRDLLPDGHTWSVDSVGTLPNKIEPWSQPESEFRFLDAFYAAKEQSR